MTTYRRAPVSTGAQNMPRTMTGSAGGGARADQREVEVIWRGKNAAEGVSAERQMLTSRDFLVNTNGVTGLMAVTEYRELMGIKRPVYFGTDDPLSTHYLLGIGGLTGTKVWTHPGGVYCACLEGHTGTGDQETWVLVEGGTATAGEAELLDMLREITCTIMTTFLGDP
jgi:hypothetical protein